MMGCSPGDSECYNDEKPAHEGIVPRGFWMGQTEVTQAAYERVIGTNPSAFKGAQRPVEQVTWEEAGEYCRKVSCGFPPKQNGSTRRERGTRAPGMGILKRLPGTVAIAVIRRMR